jgi:hypothetical protein
MNSTGRQGWELHKEIHWGCPKIGKSPWDFRYEMYEIWENRKNPRKLFLSIMGNHETLRFFS